MHEPDEPADRARDRVVRNIALSAGLAVFVVSFPAFDAVLPAVIAWLAGADPYAAPPYFGGPALARTALAGVLAAMVGASVFALLGRGVIFRSERLASPAPQQPAAAALAFGLAGLAAYQLTRAAFPALAPAGRWADDGSALLVFILVPAAFGFLWRLMSLAGEGVEARRRARRRAQGAVYDPPSRR
ncbi:MAG: hypothetical protein ACLFQ5_10810 [Oceanicaulis sp.]